MKKPTLVVALLGVVAALFAKRHRAHKSEADLWNEATGSPDLR